MKFAAAAILLGAAVVSAQKVSVADIPGCAIQCFITNVPSTGCGLMDVNCQCQPAHRSKLTSLITPCVLKACSTQNALKTQTVTNELCSQAGFSSSGSSGSSSSSSMAASMSSSSMMASSSSMMAASSSSSMAAMMSTPMATPAMSTPAMGGSGSSGSGSSPVASAQPSTYTGAANKVAGSVGAVAVGVVAAFAL